MKCLVTGAAGFIGSHLAERLLGEGHRVVGVDAFTDAYPVSLKEANIGRVHTKGDFHLVQGDLVDLDLDEVMDGVDLVFHLAAQAGVRSSWGRDFQVYVRRNVLATQRLLEACRDRPLQRFVYASSSSVYGEQDVYPTSEEALPRPLSPYGVTKLAAEHLCLLYWRNYKVPTVSLRFFTVYGPRQRPDMAFYRFLEASFRGQPITLYGDGRQSRDFTYVGDIVEANLKAAQGGREGAIYNIGGGARATLLEALDIVAEVTGRRPGVLFQEAQKGDAKHTWADLSRAKAELEYQPTVGLREGIAKEFRWMVEVMGREGGSKR